MSECRNVSSLGCLSQLLAGKPVYSGFQLGCKPDLTSLKPSTACAERGPAAAVGAGRTPGNADHRYPRVQTRPLAPALSAQQSSRFAPKFGHCPQPTFSAHSAGQPGSRRLFGLPPSDMPCAWLGPRAAPRSRSSQRLLSPTRAPRWLPASGAPKEPPLPTSDHPFPAHTREEQRTFLPFPVW